MFTIQVLGSGCSKCAKVAEKLQAHIEESGIEASIVKETNPEALIRYGVMKTPAIVINDALVHCGSIPTSSEIEAWLK